MPDITILNFNKDGDLEKALPTVAAEITDIVVLVHGWREGPESALSHYQGIVVPLEEILSQNSAQWKGRRAAYFGVIWPSIKYADDLTVLNMRIDASEPPSAVAVSAFGPAPLE